MIKEKIIYELDAGNKAFASFIASLSEKDFLFTANNKWSAGQQAEHILRSVKPVNFAFNLPVFLLKTFFGKANRPSRSYAALVQRYHEKLAEGGKASGRFIPPYVAYSQKESICNSIISVTESLCKKAEKYSDKELDNYILPHPLMGKLTLREMLYFSRYHTEHHRIKIVALLQL